MQGADSMTDREILELLLEKTTTIEGDVTGLKSQVGEMKSEINELKHETDEMKGQMTEINSQIIQLKRMDASILNEVERVHEILNKHREDRTVHTA